MTVTLLEIDFTPLKNQRCWTKRDRFSWSGKLVCAFYYGTECEKHGVCKYATYLLDFCNKFVTNTHLVVFTYFYVLHLIIRLISNLQESVHFIVWMNIIYFYHFDIPRSPFFLPYSQYRSCIVHCPIPLPYTLPDYHNWGICVSPTPLANVNQFYIPAWIEGIWLVDRISFM